MKDALDPRTPVIVGVGQFSERVEDDGYQGLSAVDLAARAAAEALADPDEALTATVSIIRLRADKELVNLATRIHAADGRLICDGEALVLVRNLESRTGPRAA